MYLKTKVAVICQDVADPKVYRLAMAVTAAAWDAGAEVRVRRVGEVTPPDDVRWSPERVEILRDCEYIAEASLDDLEWADVALFGTPARDGIVLGSLMGFIDSTVPLWKGGKLAKKVYGVFTGATRRDANETRLLSLADVFDFWGGIVILPGGAGPFLLPNDSPRSARGRVTADAPTGAELAAARDQGRQAAELAHALQAVHRTLADVA